MHCLPIPLFSAGWIYYALLPEAINREMAGQGLIGWVKMSIYDPLVRRCKGVRKTAISINIVPQQVRQTLFHSNVPVQL